MAQPQPQSPNLQKAVETTIPALSGILLAFLGALFVAAAITDAKYVTEPFVIPWHLKTYRDSVTSLTSSGRTAMVKTASTSQLENSQFVQIFGATGSDAFCYNGIFQITNVTSNTFEYMMQRAPSATAVGTITCQHPYLFHVWWPRRDFIMIASAVAAACFFISIHYCIRSQLLFFVLNRPEDYPDVLIPPPNDTKNEQAFKAISDSWSTQRKNCARFGLNWYHAGLHLMLLPLVFVLTSGQVPFALVLWFVSLFWLRKDWLKHIKLLPIYIYAKRSRVL